MMTAAFEALRKQSLRMLAVIRSGEQDEMIPALLSDRAATLSECAAVLTGGAAIGAAEAGEIMHLEQELATALRARRDAVYQELKLLQQGRRAGAAYGGATPMPSPVRPVGYIDRTG
jgi:hypothetical protein